MIQAIMQLWTIQPCVEFGLIRVAELAAPELTIVNEKGDHYEWYHRRICQP